MHFMQFIIYYYYYYFLLQFSLRSRTPSMNGSVCSPFTNRKVSFLFIIYLFIYYFFFFFFYYYLLVFVTIAHSLIIVFLIDLLMVFISDHIYSIIAQQVLV